MKEVQALKEHVRMSIEPIAIKTMEKYGDKFVTVELTVRQLQSIQQLYKSCL